MLAARIQSSDAIGAMNPKAPPIAKKPLSAKNPTPPTRFKRATIERGRRHRAGQRAGQPDGERRAREEDRETETGGEEQIVGDVVQGVVEVCVAGARDLEHGAVEHRRAGQDHACRCDAAGQHGGARAGAGAIGRSEVGPQRAHEHQEDGERGACQVIGGEDAPAFVAEIGGDLGDLVGLRRRARKEHRHDAEDYEHDPHEPS